MPRRGSCEQDERMIGWDHQQQQPDGLLRMGWGMLPGRLKVGRKPSNHVVSQQCGKSLGGIQWVKFGGPPAKRRATLTDITLCQGARVPKKQGGVRWRRVVVHLRAALQVSVP